MSAMPPPEPSGTVAVGGRPVATTEIDTGSRATERWDDRAEDADRFVEREQPRRDRVRWGPVWAGLVTTLATFVLLQLALFATDAISLDINPTESANAIPIWTAIAAAISFLLGGVVAAASTMWDRVDDGLLQGIVMWALATVALVLLSVLGAGALTSGLGDVLGRLDFVGGTLSDVNAGDVDTTGLVDDARDAAASAALFLGITVLASAIGAVIGSKMWPRRRTIDLRHDQRPLHARH